MFFNLNKFIFNFFVFNSSSVNFSSFNFWVFQNVWNELSGRRNVVNFEKCLFKLQFVGVIVKVLVRICKL